MNEMPTQQATTVARGGAPARRRVRRVPLVSPANFLLATRDTGYKSTSLAIAEFIDNSLQAGAKSIDVQVISKSESPYPIELRVVDDGSGMTAEVLASALRFGGST